MTQRYHKIDDFDTSQLMAAIDALDRGLTADAFLQEMDDEYLRDHGCRLTPHERTRCWYAYEHARRGAK